MALGLREALETSGNLEFSRFGALSSDPEQLGSLTPVSQSTHNNEFKFISFGKTLRLW